MTRHSATESGQKTNPEMGGQAAVEDSTSSPTRCDLPRVVTPPMQRPSLSRKRSLHLNIQQPSPPATNVVVPRSPGRTPNFLIETLLGSPISRAIKLTKLARNDDWLPITGSRYGNVFYAAFHTLCSALSSQALLLPDAFTVLGWAWGVICMTVVFVWLLYTIGILVKLHESTETGTRYSRYMQLFSAAFGEKMSNIFAAFRDFPGGTCVVFIAIGGSTMRTFYEIVCCAQSCSNHEPLTPVEWYLVFTCAAVVLSQLPKLNSIPGFSLICAIAAVCYCTIMWIVWVDEGRIDGVSYDPVRPVDNAFWWLGIPNSIGTIAFAFGDNDFTLEIQATMPSSEKHPSHVPMWRGVKVAYVIVALCLFPLAIAGYWAYGQEIAVNDGILPAMMYKGRDTSPSVLGLLCLFIIIDAVISFQISAVQMFDDVERKLTAKINTCPWWLRAISRAMFGYGCFFVAVAIPVLHFAGLIGAISLPLTFAVPCFMWLKIKKPRKHSFMWWLNWGLGILGSILSVVVIASGIYVIFGDGFKVRFFKPE